VAEKFKLDLAHRPRRLPPNGAPARPGEETVLRPADFIAPLFVWRGGAGRRPSLDAGRFPPQCRRSRQGCRALVKLGVPAVALFPKLDARLKDEDGTAALHEDDLSSARCARSKKRCPG